MVSKTGEDHLILSRPLLEGAVARPENLFFYEGCIDIVTLAVRLTEAVCHSHCFGQGNKRTGFHAGTMFMSLNDVFMELQDWESHAEMITKMVTGEMEAKEIVALYNSRLW